jgi:ubiquinone/menaquinone biosynthesis C-methylase UbiE
MVHEAARRCGGRATIHVADLAGPLPIASDSVDGITCSLALHYLDDWGTALASFARILKPQGWCVLSSDHPSGPRLPGQRGGYFDRELVTDRWVKDGVDVVQHFWRRPLSQTVDAFAEPQPSAEALARFPDELAVVVGTPWFAVYRLLLR